MLETGSFRRLGSTVDLKVDVRLVAATNRDLLQMSREGTFREDLFYRLNVFPVHVPPLRERRDDIPLLARHFLRRANHPGGEKRLAPEALELLKSYAWPGNIRELENMIESAVIIAESAEIQARDLPVVVRGQDRTPGSTCPRTCPSRSWSGATSACCSSASAVTGPRLPRCSRSASATCTGSSAPTNLADASVSGRRRPGAAGTH